MKNITNVIHVIDPLTGQTGTIESDAYWRDPFRPVATAARTRLTRYVVLGKDPVFLERNTSKKGVNKKQRSKLALITAARESDLGSNNSQLEERSHLGYLMKSGDICLGYDLREYQLVDDEAEEERVAGKFPDLIIVRKLYGGVATGESDSVKKRRFRLQRLEVKKGGEEDNARGKKVKKEVEMEQMDEEDFLQELEADKEMRTRVNIYKSDILMKDDATVGDDDEEDDEDDQKITLDELLDNLVLDAKPDAGDDSEMHGEIMNDDVVTEGQEGMRFVIEEGERAAKDNIGYLGRDEALHVPAKDTAIPVNAWGKEFMDKDVKFS